ncbi:DUF4252 domain-containing protein [Rhodocaloribacter litoris]|uniref:DUF4252 domain-containing protein n=1 Tax=Rhodocaloribacter litoris TaxID=2558931 RepID=UPI00141EB968|nr:DUF4252 domain-containing protein [Rhodocaloribacter litoris]QXD15485.1 DUF4252 domain-containing protein [Rhodocaloribacter litoris]
MTHTPTVAYRARLLTGLLLLVLPGVPSFAQTPLEDDPGFLDLASMTAWFDREPTLEVDIQGSLLRLVAEASRYDDPELADLLTRLRAIQVRGFPLPRTRFNEIARRTAEVATRLEAAGWDTVLRVRDYDEQVHMYVRVHDNAIAGMVVFVVKPGYDETVFVNIVGEIDPEQVGRLGRKFSFGRLER